VSRAGLIADAKRVGVATIARGRGYESPKSNEGLRIDLLERLYGKDLGEVKAKSMAELDNRIRVAVNCQQGEYGYLLGMAQYSLRNGNNARAELKRIEALKRRRPKEEAALFQTAKDAYARCRAFQDQWLTTREAK
jgi:hypothetical protein